MVFVAPGGHVLKDGEEVAAFFGEGVFASGRHFGVRFFGDDTVGF